MLILPTAYFPSIFQFAIQTQHAFLIESAEHFEKQTFRNRTEILAANGPLSLSIPLKKWKNHTLSREIQISYAEDWPSIHWKSILSAYRTSPFLEFYEDDIKPLIFQKTESLLDFNASILKELYSLLSIQVPIQYTESYNEETIDWRKIIHPKNKKITEKVTFKKYNQVFEDKFDFISNLSILDLLFNLGPQSTSYLNQIKIPEEWQKR